MRIWRGMKRAMRRLADAVALLIAIALLLVAGLWVARRGLAGAALRAALPHGEGFENTFVIRQLDFNGLELSNARLGGFPCAPSFQTLRIRWTTQGLRSRRIDAIELAGLGIDAAHRVPGFRLPALGAAGWPPLRRDLLQGWTIGEISASTARALDFGPLLPTNAPQWAAGAARGRFSLSGGLEGDSMRCRLDGDLAGLPLSVALSYSPDAATGHASLDWRIPHAAASFPVELPLNALSAELGFAFAEAHGLDCTAKGHIHLAPCEWDVPVTFRATPDGAFSCVASVEDLHLTEADPLVMAALAVAKAVGAQLPGDIAFSGDLSASAKVHVGGAAPKWSAKAAIDGLALSFKAGTVPVVVEGGRARGAAEGVAGLTRISPCFVGFDSATIGAIPFGKGRATLLPDEKSLVISEASAGFCGGAVRLYALYLDIARLSAGFTLYLDNLRLSEALNLFPQLAGSEATGSLHGRLPMHCTAEGEVRLGEGFIYTPPGEAGNVKVANSEAIEALLAQAGLPPPVSANLSKALADLDYDVLRIDLVSPREEDGRVAIRLQGKSRDGQIVTPVNVNANVNGPIEKFLNTAIRMAREMR